MELPSAEIPNQAELRSRCFGSHVKLSQGGRDVRVGATTQRESFCMKLQVGGTFPEFWFAITTPDNDFLSTSGMLGNPESMPLQEAS